MNQDIFQQKNLAEALGSGLTLEDVMRAREKSWGALETIANRIKPGMTEREAITMANSFFAEQGVKKFWHKTHIRFGASTVFSFDDPYRDDGYRLTEDDIFYLDLGPIWNGIEGDVGAAFTTGSNPIMQACVRDVKIIFDEVKDHWLQTQSTGAELVAFARQVAKDKGWVFSPEYVKGHRLSEFPHSFHFKQTLGEIGFSLSPKCWVLEISIRHPELPIGAFYEDLLV